jgi:hypothetical protein
MNVFALIKKLSIGSKMVWHYTKGYTTAEVVTES